MDDAETPGSSIDDEVRLPISATVWDKILAASMGGTISAFAVCPFDVVKARLQAQVDPKNPNLTRNIASAAKVSGDLHFTGTIDAFTKIIKYEGATKLWRGLPATLAMAVPASAIYFTSYEKLKEILSRKTQWGYITIPIVAGFGARVVTATITAPLEMIRTNMQATSSKKNADGIIQITRYVLANGGVRSLWSGLPPTLLRDAPFSAVYWSTYESLKRILKKKKVSKHNFVIDFISGAGAGVMAAGITNPVDVVKTRRQMRLGPGEYPVKTLDILRSIVQNEGMRGLTKGIVPRMAKVAPACAVMISSYEWSKKHLQRYSPS